MKTLLHIKSSIFGDAGQSSQLAEHYVNTWKTKHSSSQVIVRDLISSDLPFLDATVMEAINGDIASLSDTQKVTRELADELLTEIKSADAILMAIPYYNFNIPAQIKAYFDLLARAGVTFKYTESGAVGLLDDKPVHLITTRGGLHKDGGADYQVPYVKQFLAFIGLTQVEVVYAEGLAMEGKDDALSTARENLIALAEQ